MGSDRCVVEGIKEVRCVVCGLEIEDGEIISKNGKSYHSRCFDEFKEQERESKRNAIKVIGLGTAIAGATFLGADRLASASNMLPINRRIYPSPFILPESFSDPISPLPGQMWYRMDKGVTAYHDGINNRNIYSDRNQYIITVSPKGIANGLSTIPNDGADFGPDTTLGATSPNQIGSPYTQTSGIQEAVNYLMPDGGTIFLKKGRYKISSVTTYNVYNGGSTTQTAAIALPFSYSRGSYANLIPIRIIGEAPAGLGSYDSNAPLLENGTFIDVSGIRQHNFGAFGALFPANATEYANNSNSPQSGITVYVENIYTLHPTMPKNQSYGFGMSSVSSFRGENIGAITIDSQSDVLAGNIGQPNNYYPYTGIVMPQSGNFGDNTLVNAVVSGFNNGIAWGSHSVIINSLVQFCITAIGPMGNYGHSALIIMPNIQNCVYDIGYPRLFTFTGAVSFHVQQLDTEDKTSTTYWFKNIYTINDPNNWFNGTISFLENTILSALPTINGGQALKWLLSPSQNPIPATPAVPASGTATANVNPYSVTVYLNGGSVTQVRVTRNGAEYMLFNSAAGISMSGQGYKLEAGDTISVTYGSPPTWVWMA